MGDNEKLCKMKPVYNLTDLRHRRDSSPTVDREGAGANTVEPDQTALQQSEQGQHCLPFYQRLCSN